MTIVLMRHLHKFRGPKMRVRCFLHVINLVAKVIIRQLEDRNAGDNTIEGDDDDLGSEPEALPILTDDGLDEENVVEVEPARTMINKVSA